MTDFELGRSISGIKERKVLDSFHISAERSNYAASACVNQHHPKFLVVGDL